MFSPDTINQDPYKRTSSMYHYKITAIVGNTITFNDATKTPYTVTLDNPDSMTLEAMYREQIDNLFIAISFTNQYFFYQKLSNDRTWKTV
ncbi:MAG: hypothetical protein [Bacteriophage sp.]|nr:MAG: hypothetical protein [Bacteriophage sp.]